MKKIIFSRLFFAGNFTLLLVMLLIAGSAQQPGNPAFSFNLIDMSFNDDANSSIKATAMQADGKIITEKFISYNGTGLNCIAPLTTASRRQIL